MRITLRVPDEFYQNIIPKLGELGYTSLNDYLLGFLRVPELRQNDTVKINKPVVRQSDAVQKNVIKTPEDAIKKVKEKEPEIKSCKHGSMIGLCKYGCV